MIKNLILLVNLSAVVLFNFLAGETVTLTQNFPDNVEAGSEYTMELTINKGSVSGFAKIQQEVPEGFVVKEIDSQQASFSFSGNTIKLIWMSLPEDEEFTIKYSIMVPGDATDPFTLAGKFSYLDNNERKSASIPEKKVTIGAEEEPIADATPEAKTEQPASSAPTAAASTSDGPAATRVLTDMGNGMQRVDVQLNKPGISGFAKVQEIIPDGMDVTSEKTSDAVFSFVGGKAKFVWMAIPEGESVLVSYMVKLNGVDPSELASIKGEFSYLENNETRKIPVENGVASNTEEPIADATPAPEPEPTPTPQPVAEVTPEPTSEPTPEPTPEPEPVAEVKPEPTPEPEPEPVAEVTPEPEPEPEPVASNFGNNNASASSSDSKVNYKVQICAGHATVKRDHFETAYKFSEEYIFRENHEGWIKYTIGSFEAYKIARDRRNEVTGKYNFPGPFVTAYNQGERITVQEALMLSNQKWVQ